MQGDLMMKVPFSQRRRQLRPAGKSDPDGSVLEAKGHVIRRSAVSGDLQTATYHPRPFRQIFSPAASRRWIAWHASVLRKMPA